jgi:WD40 repeat protein
MGAALASGAFPGPVTSASFFYCDKYVLVSSADTVYAFSYALDTMDEDEDSTGPSPRDDITRQARKRMSASAYERVSWWQVDSPVTVGESGIMAPSNIVSIAAHNSFRSHLVFALSGGGKSVHVFDAGLAGGMAEVARFAGISSKPCHSLALPLASSSPYSAVMPVALDVFGTATTENDGTIRLFDLRAGTCVRQFSGSHINCVHTCGIAFSPNCYYVAAGSEDRAVVLYDVRMEREACVKLRGFKDTVTTAAFSPTTGALVAGALDGSILTFTSPHC